MYKHHFGESGGMAEADFFGVIDKSKFVGELKQKLKDLESDPSKKELLNAYYEKLRQALPPYEPRSASFDLIKRCQRTSPAEPEKEYARVFRAEVLKQISAGLGKNLPNESVLFYTACSDVEVKHKQLHTSLDQWHGIDAFLEVDLGEGKQTRVTIDGSIDPNKTERRTKSDIVTVWPESLDSRLNPVEYEGFVGSEAGKVVSHLGKSGIL